MKKSLQILKKSAEHSSSLRGVEEMHEPVKGTIYIVDISGYSSFVMGIPNETGARIIPELLDSIIKANNLSLSISEIEGDAILFYHFGPAFRIYDVLQQFQAMLISFKNKIRQLKPHFPQVSDLSIKLVAHYGEISRFSVCGFDKLYGQSLIEAHRLLKNHIGLNTYALITNEYFLEQPDRAVAESFGGHDCYEIYDVGKISCTYYSYSEVHGKLLELTI